MDLDKATDLARETDYADAANQEHSKINWGDAGAFFLEGYNYARSTKEWTREMKIAFTRYKCTKEEVDAGTMTDAQTKDWWERARSDAVDFINAVIKAQDLNSTRDMLQ